MYLITIIFRQNNHTPQFHFDQFKDADGVLKRAYPQSVRVTASTEARETAPPKVEMDKGLPVLFIEDDYGSKASVDMLDVAGIFLTELDREMAAQEVAAMAKIQSDLRIRKKVSQDPSARLMVPGVAGNS